MSESPNLSLPFIEAGQAQKHVTHNEALRTLDVVTQLAVVAVSESPPAEPAEGERHIVDSTATGHFAGHAHEIAVFQDGAWQFLTPKVGWRAWNADAETLLVWTGSAWSQVSATGGSGGVFDPDDVSHLYINGAEPEDASTKLAVRSNDVLMYAVETADSGSGDVRLQLSKEAAENTASVFFSRDFSGRAEFGLVESDEFQLKVSADGETWLEAMRFDAGGRVSFPQGGARERLTANRTYYVDGANGDDGNRGFAPGDAFATIQRAVDVVFGSLDLDVYDATIQIADGTYAESVLASSALVGAGSVTLLGNVSNPENVVIDGGSWAVRAENRAALRVQALEVRAGNSGVWASLNGFVIVRDGVRFGVCSSSHIRAQEGGIVYLLTPPSVGSAYSIVGNAGRHYMADPAGLINAFGANVNLIGTPAFSAAFAAAGRGGAISARESVSFTGSATGQRYSVYGNGIVDTNGGGPNFFPGNATGSSETGGQYL